MTVQEQSNQLTYVKVGAQGAIHDRSLRFVREQEDLRLSWIVTLEDVVILARDVDSAIADMSESHLLDLVCVKFLVTGHVLLDRSRERRVNAIGRVLSDALTIADRLEFLAVDGADTDHLFVLDAELFVLALVHR